MFSTEEIRTSILYSQIYETRKKMSPKRRERTIAVESKLIWKYPYASELTYTKWIDQEFRINIVQPLIQTVLLNYDSWKKDYKKDSDLHEDALMDIFRALKNSVRNAFHVLSRVDIVGADVNRANNKEWERFVKEASGVNLQMYSPTAQKYVQEWADANKLYLSTLPDEFVNKINQIVSDGIESRLSKMQIEAAIREAGKKFRGVFSGQQNRAERIARDQVGKLNSTLSRARMREAKLDVYKWSTSADERVRGTPGGKYPNTKYSHYIMDGKYKQVDNANKISDNGIDWRNVKGKEEPRHAGQAINCRCGMIPSFIRLKKIIDEDIRKAA